MDLGSVCLRVPGLRCISTRCGKGFGNMRGSAVFGRRRLGMLAGAVGALLSCGAAMAQTAAAPSVDRIAALEKAASANTAAIANAQSAGDNAWMLVSAALVLMMSGPGLALFYGGLVRKKNVL